MKCPNCNGTGKVEVESGIFTIHGCDCVVCYGTGVVEPITNEEHLKSCNTEQLAEFLTKVILDDKRFRMTMVGGVNETKLWLKQPHSSPK